MQSIATSSRTSLPRSQAVLARSCVPRSAATSVARRSRCSCHPQSRRPGDVRFSSFSAQPPQQPLHPTQAKSHAPIPQKRTLQKLQSLHDKGEPIAVLTAHDYPSAFYLEQAGSIDICLVGDSLAMVACGYETTNQLSLDEMLYHCRSVARACKTPLLVGDMPYGTYQLDLHDAVANALRIIQQGHMEAVKLEGGKEIADLVNRLTNVGVPVMGHVGLKPQHSVASSGFKVQGKTGQRALDVLEDALAIQEAGAFSIVLEAIPSKLGAYITSKLRLPTISIGAGPECSGQVLVQPDMLGGFDRFMPKFCKRFADQSATSIQAIQAYADEVKQRTFPQESTHTYPIKEEEWVKFQALAKDYFESKRDSSP